MKLGRIHPAKRLPAGCLHDSLLCFASIQSGSDGGRQSFKHLCIHGNGTFTAQAYAYLLRRKACCVQGRLCPGKGMQVAVLVTATQKHRTTSKSDKGRGAA